MSKSLKIWLPVVRAGSGSDVFVMRLAKGLRRVGHDPVVQWFEHKYELMPWRLNSVAPPKGIDIIHAGTWQGFAFKRAGIPLVLTEHHFADHPELTPYRTLAQSIYHNYFIRQCTRRSYAVADALVAVSDFCAKEMRSSIGSPINVIHNWVDNEKFYPDERDFNKSDRLSILFVGNPSVWKGSDILPSLAEELGPSFDIYCLGGLRKKVSPKGLPKNVHVLDRATPDEMPKHYRAVDVTLVLSRYETFGYIALEAMSCGIPVVGFNSSGTAEVCVHEETALLAPVDDIGRLASYLRAIKEAPLLRQRLGAAGRLRAIEYFNEAQAIEKYCSVYDQVMREREMVF